MSAPAGGRRARMARHDRSPAARGRPAEDDTKRKVSLNVGASVGTKNPNLFVPSFDERRHPEPGRSDQTEGRRSEESSTSGDRTGVPERRPGVERRELAQPWMA
ncbi:MAG: hypothetical protein AAF670_19090 [Planctomycetota bacterium]